MVEYQLPALSFETCEDAIAPLFSKVASQTARNAPLDQIVFDKISSLLLSAGKRAWADRPRTYTVLRLIDRIDAMDDFVLNDFLDIQLPYTERRLPEILKGSSRHTFLEKQAVVLTGANELELERGRHRHLNVDGDTFFTILSHLGAGKYGRVDRVRSKLSLEEYARKRIARSRTFSRGTAGMRIFENELSHLKRLRHHHLVTFIGSYTDPRWVAMLMTPVADCDLHAFLRQTRFGPPEMSMLRRFFGCLCSAVQYLHGQKCRHKDIKPGNILVRKGDVFVTDFGMARDWSDLSGGSTSGTVGPFTPRFAAPEVMHSERRNEQSDIWSLGCVYLDMVTRLKGKSIEEMLVFFDTHGSGLRPVAHNPVALRDWLLHLESPGSDDNVPFQWIRSMLHESPLLRPSANGVLDTILVHEDDNIYYGDCCGPSDNNCSTYRGSLSAAGGVFLVPDLANTSLQQNLATKSTRKTSTLMENDVPTPTNIFSANIGVRQPNSNADVVSLSDSNNATIASSAPARDSLLPAKPARATFLSRPYTAAFYRTLERDFQNARDLLAAMSDGNWGFHEFCEPPSYTSKNFVDTANSIHWERQYFSIDVLGRRFDTYGFGKWFCQRVAYHLGTGPKFSTAGRIWLNILLLELRIVIQTELLHAAKLMYSSEGLRPENPWLIPESEVSKVMESNSKCRHSWEAFKEELR